MAARAAPPAGGGAGAPPPHSPRAQPAAARAPSLSGFLPPPSCPALESADDSELGPAQFALANPVVLSSVFAALPGPDLARCAAVCGLWRDLLLRDAGADAAIWQAAYMAEHGAEPLPREWAGRCAGAHGGAWRQAGARGRMQRRAAPRCARAALHAAAPTDPGPPPPSRPSPGLASCLHTPPPTHSPPSPPRPVSYRAMYARAARLLRPAPAAPLPLGGPALCYSPGAAAVVAFAPRSNVLSALPAAGGAPRSVAVPDRGVLPGGAPGRPLLAALEGSLVVLTTGDGVLQVRGRGGAKPGSWGAGGVRLLSPPGPRLSALPPVASQPATSTPKPPPRCSCGTPRACAPPARSARTRRR
jgi:hypothetical protein